MIVSLFVWTKHGNVMDGETDRQTESHWLLQLVLLRISKSCKRTDSDGFLKKIRGSGRGFGFWMKVLYRIYSRISRKIDDKIMPQKLGGDLSPGLY